MRRGLGCLFLVPMYAISHHDSRFKMDLQFYVFLVHLGKEFGI